MTTYKGWRRKYKGKLKDNGTITGATVELWVSSKGDQLRLHRNLSVKMGEQPTFYDNMDDRTKFWVVSDNSGTKDYFSSKLLAEERMQEILKNRYDSDEIEPMPNEIPDVLNK